MLAPHLTSAPRHQAGGEGWLVSAVRPSLCVPIEVYSARIQGKLDEEGEGLYPSVERRKKGGRVSVTSFCL